MRRVDLVIAATGGATRLDALRTWLIQTRISVADGGGTAKALDYSIKRWPALIRYAESGMLLIDNNPVENSIRPIAIGKKNWLFAGSERAGRRAAAIQSLLGTAKLNGLDPHAWLKDTLRNCRSGHIAGLMSCCHSGWQTVIPKKSTWRG